MNPEFWRGRRVLVTGHSGFKGGWLCLMLDALGAKVTGCALAPESEQPSFYDLCNVATFVDSHFVDIRDYTKLSSVFEKCEPDVVLHLAAQPLVRESYRNPIETYSTNVIGTVNILEIVGKAKKTTAFVNATTDKCYANKEWLWPYRETDELGGVDPYSASKACSEIITSSYQAMTRNANRKELRIASARAGNVIGGGDWSKERLIPDLVRAVESGTSLTIRHPFAVRPWQYVLDPLRGYLILAERLYLNGQDYVGAWNFGPLSPDTTTVGQLASSLASMMNGRVTSVEDKAFHESSRLSLDCSKAANRLDWRPLVALPEALNLISNWYAAHKQGAEMQSFSQAEMNRYLELVTQNENSKSASQ